MPPPAPLPPAPLPPSGAALLLVPLSVLGHGVLFWPAACLVAILAARERQHGAMLIWYGLAVGFDAQALLLAPFIVALLIGRRAPARLIPVAPLFAAAMLAARAPDLASIAILPQDIALSHGAPNLWAIAQALPWIADLPLTGLALTTALGSAAAYVAWGSARRLNRGALLDAALLCALVMPAVLPALDGRAFLLADGLAVAIAVLDGDRASRRIAVLAVTGSLLAQFDGALTPLAASMMLLATAMHARIVFKPAANDNPLMARMA